MDSLRKIIAVCVRVPTSPAAMVIDKGVPTGKPESAQ
jgi:hypothetical protein